MTNATPARVTPADGDGLDVGAALREAVSLLWDHDTGDCDAECRADMERLDRIATASAMRPAAPSFANPVSLTSELLAEHGGTLPEGTVLRRGDDFIVVRDGELAVGAKIRLPLVSALNLGGYRVVHLGAES